MDNTDDIRRATERAERAIAEAVRKLIAELPAYAVVDDIEVALSTIEMMGGERKTIIGGVNIRLAITGVTR